MSFKEVLKRERFVFYPECWVCDYYKRYFYRLLKLVGELNPETVNYDWHIYEKYKQHIKGYHSDKRELTLIGKI